MTERNSYTLARCRERAWSNAMTAIRQNSRFPQNVFLGDWDEFLFFNSDLIFGPEFIQITTALREAEGSACVSICNLDKGAAPLADGTTCIAIDKDTAEDGYVALLRGNGPADGWIYRIDSYVCASDIGQWCIYCEKGNEVAVIAIKEGKSREEFGRIMTNFGALPVRAACEAPVSYGLSRAALPDFLSKLVQEFTRR